MRGKDLYKDGPAAGAQAPILVTHFEGALDAGSAGTLAVVQMLRNLSAQRVLTFDADILIDYRSHRPMMVVEDWVTKDVIAPEIALDLVHDDKGTPLLILHGPEPDARWHSFADAVAEIAHDAGVEIAIAFHGIPAAVPHTRPVSVHLQSTDEDLVPEQPLMGGLAQFPAPLTAFLHNRLAADNIEGLTLLAAVPYYMSDSAFPRASSALLRRLAELAELSLPVGDLERGADVDASQVDHLVGQNPDVQRTVEALESHYDALIKGQVSFPFSEEDVEGASEDTDASRVPSPDMSFDTSRSVADEIGDAIEKYLANQMKQKEPAAEEEGPKLPSVGDVDSSDAPQPRHRAPRPWEQQS